MGLRSAGRRLLLRTATGGGLDALWLRVAAGRRPLVRIVMAHGTPRRLADDLKRQLDWVAERFRIIDLAGLARCWEQGGGDPDPRPAVLFTFDDGLASNCEVAAPILESYGARGVFFVPPAFVQCRGEEARRFVSLHLDPGADTGGWPEEAWRPMTPEQVAELCERGHSVGNHTASHARLSALAPAQQVREIEEGAARLAEWTGREVEAFAWTFAWDAIGPEGLRTAIDTHRFCFSPCPGAVHPGADRGADRPQLIWRTNIEPHYEPREYRFMYSGLADPIWSSRRARLRDALARAEAIAAPPAAGVRSGV